METNHMFLKDGKGLCSCLMHYNSDIETYIFCDQTAYGTQIGSKTTKHFTAYLACPEHGGPDKPANTPHIPVNTLGIPTVEDSYFMTLTKEELVEVCTELSKDCTRLRQELDDKDGIIR